MKSAKKTQKASAILYHYPCPDGAFAALAAHLYFSAASLPALFFPNTVYSPITAQQLPLSEIGDLYLLDFVGSPGFGQEISSSVDRCGFFFFFFFFFWLCSLFLFLCCSVPVCEHVCVRFFRVVVLDHHKTALEKLSETAAGENVIKVIDMERSGATIAFDYFKEKLKFDPNQTAVEVGEFDRLGPLFKYVEDGDLWRWRLPNSKAFNSGLKDSGIEFDVRLNPSLFQQVINLLGLMIFIPMVLFFFFFLYIY
jgi:hypothetical protein